MTHEKKFALAKRIIAVFITLAMVFAFESAGMFGNSETQAKSKAKYWLKVNTKTCVVTAYKKSGKKWKAVRAMLCSPGKSATPTIKGTFKLGQKQRWGVLMGGCWGQYTSRIHGGYLFHSVPYDSKNRKTQWRYAFNKLGKPASHGCVRLSTIDAKWIYKNCRKGTKVTVFSGSSKKDPLGKPKRIVSKGKWDPTDYSKKNKNYRLRKAVFSISKSKYAEYSKTAGYSVMSGVKVTNTNANENINAWTKYKLTKSGKTVKAKNMRKSVGTYKIKYYTKYGYVRNASRTFSVIVRDTKAPVLTASARTVSLNTKNAVTGVSAKHVSGKSLTSAITATVKDPNGNTQSLDYAGLKAYSFDTAGTYSITYKVKGAGGKYYSTKSASKTVTITVSE